MMTMTNLRLPDVHHHDNIVKMLLSSVKAPYTMASALSHMNRLLPHAQGSLTHVQGSPAHAQDLLHHAQGLLCLRQDQEHQERSERTTKNNQKRKENSTTLEPSQILSSFYY